MQGLCRKFIINPFQSHKFIHGFQSLLLHSTAAATTEDFFANYLVDSLSFSNQKALLISNRLSQQRKVNDFSFDSNAISVVEFLKNRGFDDTHVRKIVASYPHLLCSKVDDTLRPKLQFLQDQGFSESDIIRAVSANPTLLVSGLQSRIVPTVDILRQVMGCDAHVIAILKNFRAFKGVAKCLIPNVALLTSYGKPIELIRKHLLLVPTAYLRKPDQFKDIVARVENKLGIRPESPMFMYGIQLLCGYSEETIESKCRVFKSFGWTQSDVDIFLMKRTCCFNYSDATIKKKLDFLMNELRLEPAYVRNNTAFFSCSLEKRIVPRHKVLLILKEKGLLEKNPSLNSAICMSESRFLSMFVLPFKEVHDVYAKLTGFSIEKLIQQ